MSNKSTPIDSTTKSFSSLDQVITIYVNIPMSALGFLMHLVIVWVFSHNNEFKEQPIKYLRIDCLLIAIDMVIITLRSIASNFMCIHPSCSPELNSSLNESLIRTLVFVYLPSPLEASALVAEICTVLSRLAQFKPKYRGTGLHFYILNAHPYRVILITFVFFAILFSYQIFAEPDLFHIDFFLKHARSLSILTFAIRDGFFLLVLILLNVKIAKRVNSSMRKKMNMIGSRVVERATRARSRTNVIILAACTSSIIGRLSILFFILASCFYESLLVDLMAFCILGLILSYNSKFFMFLIINKRFRNVLIEKLGFKKYSRV